ncbi:MAG TPA: hypothetical protein VFS39_05810, partial [Nitrospira sp.]|nr:hypothetical protein [Nitrospira sp.]
HSMEQILEMCSRVVWLDQGKIRMQGEAFLVVKAYEEFIHGSVDGTSTPGRWNGENGRAGLQEADARKLSGAVSPTGGNGAQHRPHLQQPAFRPNGDPIDLPDVSFAAGREYRFEASGGISRWTSEVGVKVCGFSILTERGSTNKLVTLRPARFVFFLTGEQDKEFQCLYGFVVHDLLGHYVTRIFSPPDRFYLKAGELRRVTLTLNPVQLGPGEYTISLTVLENSPLELINSGRRFDQLARSFKFEVELPLSLGTTVSNFYHSGEWNFESQAEVLPAAQS